MKYEASVHAVLYVDALQVYAVCTRMLLWRNSVVRTPMGAYVNLMPLRGQGIFFWREVSCHTNT
jgi:hypothetical protein